MSENKMSIFPFPLKLKVNFIEAENGITIAELYGSNKSERGAAIISAINETYGKGINPEAVYDLLELVKSYYSQLESTDEIGGLTESGKDNYEKCYAAIEKSKII